MEITEDQMKTIRQLSLILGKTEQEIMSTPFESLIRILIKHIN
jgi:hypothetical protein